MMSFLPNTLFEPRLPRCMRGINQTLGLARIFKGAVRYGICRNLQPSGQAPSGKSLNPYKLVIQTANDIVKAHVGGLKIEIKDRQGSTFRISLSGS